MLITASYPVRRRDTDALFDSREQLKQALGKYADHRAAGPVAARLVASTWGQHTSILSLFYRWAIGQGHAEAEPFTYRTARALFNGTGRQPVQAALVHTPHAPASPLAFAGLRWPSLAFAGRARDSAGHRRHASWSWSWSWSSVGALPR